MKLKRKKELFNQLGEIKDFRDTDKITYQLNEILFMSLFGLLKGNHTFEQLHDWMEFNSDNKIFLKLFDKKVIDIPCESTLHRMLVNTDNEALEKVFVNFFSKYVKKKNIAVDGKWLNGSDVNGQYTKESHKLIFNIFDKDSKIVMAHKFLKKSKLSEIPAFTELLEDDTFNQGGQIFSFDALMTQVDILDTINNANNKYIAKVKYNQKSLRDKVELKVNDFHTPSEVYEDMNIFQTEGNKSVRRKVEIYHNRDCDIVLYDSKFKNIQTIIKTTKETVNGVSGEIKTTIQYLIANFKTSAKEFKDIILQHWGIETYHYHLDMLTREDAHICYVDPFSISILRSFAVNLYQLFFNKYKGEKIIVENVQTKKPLT
ncbi:MAG: ISAs1 family transposase, partial [Campylobacterota bacterium]|nr:ISAs1 family transposase [Campylobacterota bacterium]